MNALAFPDGNWTMQSEKESTIVRRILHHRQCHVNGVAFANTAHVARQRLCVFLPFEGENFLTTMGMKQLSHIRIANDTKHLALMLHTRLNCTYTYNVYCMCPASSLSSLPAGSGRLIGLCRAPASKAYGRTVVYQCRCNDLIATD